MNKNELDKITDKVVETMRDGDTFYSNDEEVRFNLVDMIASLHNLLYEEVTGKRYDYMFHWTNKAGFNGVVDNMFDYVFEEVNADEESGGRK